MFPWQTNIIRTITSSLPLTNIIHNSAVKINPSHQKRAVQAKIKERRHIFRAKRRSAHTAHVPRPTVTEVIFMFLTLFALLTRILHMILGIGTPQNFPPPLPHEEEQECFLQAERGDEDARQKLILHNLRLVSHIVRKYYSTARNLDDLVSIGTIGLVKAVDTFNVHNGARFATYAAKCIQNAILS